MSEANSAGLQQSSPPGSPLTVTGAGVESDGAVAGRAAEVAIGDGREDLTVFFSIGIAVDVLLVTVFLVWAIRQWRKAGK
ncbi:MAG: hypothetical protein ACE5FQ_04970 [Thiogranum sp.]